VLCSILDDVMCFRKFQILFMFLGDTGHAGHGGGEGGGGQNRGTPGTQADRQIDRQTDDLVDR
jgi:hypothetical protein